MWSVYVRGGGHEREGWRGEHAHALCATCHRTTRTPLSSLGFIRLSGTDRSSPEASSSASPSANRPRL